MELFTIKETAHILRVSPITVRRYIAAGRLEAERVGRGIRIRREAIEDFVEPISPLSARSEVDPQEKLPIIGESLGISIGIGRSAGPTNIAEYKDNDSTDAYSVSNSDQEDENLVEVYTASGPDGEEFVPNELLGTPTSDEDPLWDIVGIGRSDGPNDVARNKYKYLADAILSRKSME